MYGVTSVIVTAAVLPLLGLLAVCLRFYVRVRLTRTYIGIDDWLIAFSSFLVLSQGAMQIIGKILNSQFPYQNGWINIRLKLKVVLTSI